MRRKLRVIQMYLFYRTYYTNTKDISKKNEYTIFLRKLLHCILLGKFNLRGIERTTEMKKRKSKHETNIKHFIVTDKTTDI